MSEQNKTFYQRLIEAKKEIGKATKNSTNPHFKSKYVDINALIETVEPSLLNNGLILLQPVENGNVITRIIDAESGEQIESSMPLIMTGTPQAIGSQITYYRRYTLQALLSMQAQDDDGHLASIQPTAPIKKKLTDDGFSKAVDKYLTGDKDYFDKLLKADYEFTASQAAEIEDIKNSNI